MRLCVTRSIWFAAVLTRRLRPEAIDGKPHVVVTFGPAGRSFGNPIRTLRSRAKRDQVPWPAVVTGVQIRRLRPLRVTRCLAEKRVGHVGVMIGVQRYGRGSGTVGRRGASCDQQRDANKQTGGNTNHQ